MDGLGGNVNGVDGWSIALKVFVRQAKCDEYSIGSPLLELELDVVNCQIDK